MRAAPWVCCPTPPAVPYTRAGRWKIQPGSTNNFLNAHSAFVYGTGELDPREAGNFLQVFNKVWQENGERAAAPRAELPTKQFSLLRLHL